MQANTCRLCKFIPCQQYIENNNILKECRVECEGYIIKIQLALSSFLVRVPKGSRCMKNKISCFTFSSNTITKQDCCGLCSYRTTLLPAPEQTGEVRAALPIQLRTCSGLCLLTLTSVSLFHKAGSRTLKQLISVVFLLCHCSVFLHS